MNPDQKVQELCERSQIKTEAEHSSQQPSNSQYSSADSATSNDNSNPPTAPPTAPPTDDPTILVPVEERPLPEPPLREEEGKSNEELGETKGRDEMQGRSED